MISKRRNNNMIILIALLIVILIGVIIHIKYRNLITSCFLILGTVLFLSVSSRFIIYYRECQSEILIFEKTSLAYKEATAYGDNIVEAFQAKESNRWLLEQQRRNKTIFGIAIPDKVMEMEMIK